MVTVVMVTCRMLQAKKAREQAALQHAQSLFDQLDAEKEKKESRRKAAAKKRDKRKKKKRAGKTDAMEAEKEEDLGVLEDGREGPDGEEGEGSGTPPQPPPSPEFVTSGEVSGMSRVRRGLLGVLYLEFGCVVCSI